MAYRNRQEFDLRTLINQLDRYFQEMPDIQAGYKTLSRESGDPFVRVSLRKGKDNTNPLYFDIAPTASRGPFPAYLEPSMRTDSPSYYQAEGVIDQSGQTIRTPFEAIAHTVQSAREFSEESIREKGPIAGTSWQDAWGVLRSVGSVEYQIPGSAPRNIETQRESTREDTSQWFAFFVDPSVRTNEADEIIRRRQADPAAGPQGERWWLLQGYGLSSQESSRGGSTVMRFKPVVPGGDPSPLAPVSADKRRSIGFGLGGTREEATVLTTDPSDPTKMIPLQPQLITGMEDHERGGYRWLNAKMPGETERRKVLVRLHTAVRSGTTVPGAVLDYQDPFMGQAAGAGIKSTAKPSVSMPEGNIPGYLKAKFWWKEDLAGTVVKAGTTMTIGGMTDFPTGKPYKEDVLGPDGEILHKRGDEIMIDEPFKVTAGTSDIVLTGERSLNLPPAYYHGTARIGQGHPGLSPGESGLKGPLSVLTPEMLSGIRSEFEGEVNPVTGGSVTVGVGAIKITGTSSKGFDWKTEEAAMPGVHLIDQYAPELLEATGPSGESVPIRHITGDLKGALGGFTGDFLTMPTDVQRKLVETVFPGKMGDELSGFLQSQLELTKAIDASPAGDPKNPLTGAFDLQEFANIWYRNLAGEEPPRESEQQLANMAMEHMRQRFEQQSPKIMAEFDNYRNLGGDAGLESEPIVTTTRTAEMTREHWTTFFMEKENVPREAAEAMAKQHLQFRKVGRNREIQSTIAPTDITTMTTPVVPEYMAGQTKSGPVERALHQQLDPSSSDLLNLNPRQSPSATGFRPRSVEAWDQVLQAATYNMEEAALPDVFNYRDTQGGRLRAKERPGVVDPNAMILNDLQKQEVKELLRKEAPLPELAKLISSYGSGNIYNPEAEAGYRYIEQPQTMIDIAQEEYGPQSKDPAAKTYLNRQVRHYRDNLAANIFGMTSETVKATQEEREKLLSSKSKTIAKNFLKSYSAGGISGRSQAGLGTDPEFMLIEEEPIYTAMKEIAKSRNLPMKYITGFTDKEGEFGEKGARVEGWMDQLKAQMRQMEATAVTGRYPIDTLQQVGILTPEIATEITGIVQPKAARLGGKEIEHGNISLFSAGRISQAIALQSQADFDADTIKNLLGFNVSETDPTKLDFADPSGLIAQRGQSAQETVARLQAMLTKQFGASGGAAGEFNEIARAIRDITEGETKVGARAALEEVDMFRLSAEQRAGLTSTAGLGVAHNQRSLLQAAGAAIGATGDVDFYQSGALQQQRYVDKSAGVTTDYKNVESYIQGSFLEKRKQGPSISTMTTEGGGWKVMTEYHKDADMQRLAINKGLGVAGLESVVQDVVQGHMTAGFGGELLAQSGLYTPEELAGVMQEGQGQDNYGFATVSTRLQEFMRGREAIRKDVKPDYTRTRLGTATFAKIFGKAETAERKDPRTGQPYNVMAEVGDQSMYFQGGLHKIADLPLHPVIRTTNALEKAITGKGVLLPSERVAAQQHLVETYGGLEDVPMFAQSILAAYPIATDTVAVNKATEQVLEMGGDPGQLGTINRPSQADYTSKEDYEVGGAVINRETGEKTPLGAKFTGKRGIVEEPITAGTMLDPAIGAPNPVVAARRDEQKVNQWAESAVRIQDAMNQGKPSPVPPAKDPKTLFKHLADDDVVQIYQGRDKDFNVERGSTYSKSWTRSIDFAKDNYTGGDGFVYSKLVTGAEWKQAVRHTSDMGAKTAAGFPEEVQAINPDITPAQAVALEEGRFDPSFAEDAVRVGGGDPARSAGINAAYGGGGKGGGIDIGSILGGLLGGEGGDGEGGNPLGNILRGLLGGENDPTGILGAIQFQVTHGGQEKIQGLREQQYQKGVIALQRLKKGGGNAAAGAIEKLLLETGKVPNIAGAQQLVRDPLSQHRLASTLEEVATEFPDEFEAMWKESGKDIQEVTRMGGNIAGAAREVKSRKLDAYARSVEGQMMIAGSEPITAAQITATASGDAPDSSIGTGAEGRLIAASTYIEQIAKEKGLKTGGAGKSDIFAGMSEERVAGITNASDEVIEKFKALAEQVDKVSDLEKTQVERKEELIKYHKLEADALQAKAREQLQITSGKIEVAQAEISEAAALGLSTTKMETQLGKLYESKASLAADVAGIQEMQEGGGAPPWQRALKTVTGGWNLMYMQRMLGLGTEQLSQGYAEQQQYQQGMAQMARGALGSGAPVYESPELRYERALLRGASPTGGGLREIQAGITGLGLGGVSGALMEGVGVTSTVGFLSQSLTGLKDAPKLQEAGQWLGKAAIGAGVVTAGLTLAGNQLSYAMNQDQTEAQIAATFQQSPLLAGAQGALKLGLTSIGQMLGGTAPGETSFWQAAQQGANLKALTTGYEEYTGKEQEREWTDEEILQMATAGGYSEDYMKGLTAQQRGTMMYHGARAGLEGEELEQIGMSIGLAQQAGIDTMAMARVENRLAGEEEKTYAELMRSAAAFGDLTDEEQLRTMTAQQIAIEAGMTSDDLGPVGSDYRKEMDKKLSALAAGEGGAAYVFAKQQQKELAGLGVYSPVSIEDFTGTGADFQQTLMADSETRTRQLNFGRLFQQENVPMEVIGKLAGFDSTKLEELQKMTEFDAYSLTRVAQDTGRDGMNMMAERNINMQGEITQGMWGTSSLARGSGIGEWSNVGQGRKIFGDDWASSRSGRAAVLGTTNLLGDLVGGMEGLQVERQNIQWEYQDAQMQLSKDRLGAQAGYMGNIWAIQDKQRALAHEKAMYGFEMQERQFEMGGRQWEEQRGLARRGQLMQRGWQQQDWAMQDQQVALQWQWQQEDFDENVRFMSGRQRKIAERGMERQTIMHGLSETQRDREKDRQKEIWTLADERFNMERDHYEENRELMEENMAKQKEFYLEGKKLQDEMIEAQRAYQSAQIALQQKAIELQEQYTKDMRDNEIKMAQVNLQQEKYTTNIKDLIDSGIFELFIEMINAMGDVDYEKTISTAPVASDDYSTQSDDYYDKMAEYYSSRQTGGDVIPGVSYMVGERETEMFRSGRLGSIVTKSDIAGAKRMYNDRWGDSQSFDKGGSGSSGGQVLNVYIGEKKIKQFIIDTISEELEVH